MKIIDDDEVFSLNPDMKVINELKINNKVIAVEIENFYCNPDDIKYIMDNTHCSINFRDKSKYPGFRSSNPRFFSAKHIKKVYDVIIKYLDIKFKFTSLNDESKTLLFNYSNSDIKSIGEKDRDLFGFLPHTDRSLVNVMTFLDLDSQHGTSLYKELASDLNYIASDDYNKKLYLSISGTSAEYYEKQIDIYDKSMKQRFKDYENCPADFDVYDYYDCVFKSSGKYNTAIIFLGDIIHGQNWTKNCEICGKRASQIHFFTLKKTKEGE